MATQRLIGGLALFAFLFGGVGANIMHGPSGLDHLHGQCSHTHQLANEAVVKPETHTCVQHHHDGHRHNHGDHQHVAEHDAPANAPHDHDCPVCDHLMLSVIATAAFELPTLLQETARVATVVAVRTDLGPIGVSLSRGPPTA